MRRPFAFLALVLVSLAPAVTRADAAVVLTLEGPSSATVGVPARFSGRLSFAGVAGVPAQAVDVLVDDETVATTATRHDGTYAIELTFDEQGAYRVQARALVGTPVEAHSDVLTVDAVEHAMLTIDIEGVTATRLPAEVQVSVVVAGTLLGANGPIAGGVVEGSVTVTAPNPCWPDPGTTCVDVIDEQTLEFATPTGADGSYSATVGPFRYQAGAGPYACTYLSIAADASWSNAEASDSDAFDVCA